MSSHQEYRLIQEIVSRSRADTWDEAKLEWALVPTQAHWLGAEGTKRLEMPVPML